MISDTLNIITLSKSRSADFSPIWRETDVTGTFWHIIFTCWLFMILLVVMVTEDHIFHFLRANWNQSKKINRHEIEITIILKVALGHFGRTKLDRLLLRCLGTLSFSSTLKRPLSKLGIKACGLGSRLRDVVKYTKSYSVVQKQIKRIGSYVIPIPTHLLRKNITWINQPSYHRNKNGLWQPPWCQRLKKNI